MINNFNSNSIIDYDPNFPIIVGFAGKALTGKTVTAERIAPKAKVLQDNDLIIYDHIYFALPLYELAAIRKMILGSRQRTRQLYAIHDTLYNLFGGSPIGNMPDYDTMVQLVNEIYELPIEPEHMKPRSFLQKAGDLCRAIDKDCFSRWAVTKSKSLHQQYLRGLNEDATAKPMAVIISDVRFINEANAIKSTPNGIVVCFTAADSVREERMMKRDGRLMTDEQKRHQSELEVDEIMLHHADYILATDNLTEEEQESQTVNIILNLVGAHA